MPKFLVQASRQRTITETSQFLEVEAASQAEAVKLAADLDDDAFGKWSEDTTRIGGWDCWTLPPEQHQAAYDQNAVVMLAKEG